MKVGTKVAVCQDGKWGRRVPGIVIQQRNGHHIKVRFTYPGEPETEFWARRTPAIHGRWNLPVRWGGWADVDCFCPWFSVSKWKEPE